MTVAKIELALALILILSLLSFKGVSKEDTQVFKYTPYYKIAKVRKEVHPIEYTEEDVAYLTQALYFEAATEPRECQIMVANVIINRKYDHTYPNSIKEVIWEKKQFSYTHDGKPEKMSNKLVKENLEDIARLVLGGYLKDNTGGALHYYNPKLANPRWKKSLNVFTKCGDHLFLIDKDKRD